MKPDFTQTTPALAEGFAAQMAKMDRQLKRVTAYVDWQEVLERELPDDWQDFALSNSPGFPGTEKD